MKNTKHIQEFIKTNKNVSGIIQCKQKTRYNDDIIIDIKNHTGSNYSEIARFINNKYKTNMSGSYVSLVKNLKIRN
jgi:hypothetical protein